MLQRHFSIFLLSIYSLFCLACLSWSADAVVRTLKYTAFYLISPVSGPFISEMEGWGAFGRHMSHMIRADQALRVYEQKDIAFRLEQKRNDALERENQRLSAFLALPPRPKYVPLAVRAGIRDTSDWFHSFILPVGRKQGIAASDPVITLQEGREVLVGEVIEVFEERSRVLLIADPLCVVSAKVKRTGEQGAVQGLGTARLEMNYLLSDSDVRVGDEVVSAGLGGIFPPDIFLGVVDALDAGSRESVKKIFLRPAVRFSHLEDMFVLRRREKEAAP